MCLSSGQTREYDTPGAAHTLRGRLHVDALNRETSGTVDETRDRLDDVSDSWELLWRVVGGPVIGAGLAVMLTRAVVDNVVPAMVANGLVLVAAIAGLLCGGVWAAITPRMRTGVSAQFFSPLVYAGAACVVVALAGTPMTAMRTLAIGAPVAILVALCRRPR